jgi:hypothetical protein
MRSGSASAFRIRFVDGVDQFEPTRLQTDCSAWASQGGVSALASGIYETEGHRFESRRARWL